MPSVSTSNVVPIQIFREKLLDYSGGATVDLLKELHAKIDDMIVRLLRCLATVRIVEDSMQSISSGRSVDEMRTALTDAQIVLDDIFGKLERMNSGRNDGPSE